MNSAMSKDVVLLCTIRLKKSKNSISQYIENTKAVFKVIHANYIM